jgi:hypothetical protein
MMMRNPRDSSLGTWGRPRGNRQGATWIDTNCLRACIATLMQWPIEKVPDPTPLFKSHREGWRDAYNGELKKSCGARLEEIPAGGCQPVGRLKSIAAITATADADHAVCANGDGLIYHDPNGHELNGLPVPRDRLLFGLRIVPANAPKRDRWGRPLGS